MYTHEQCGGACMTSLLVLHDAAAPWAGWLRLRLLQQIAATQRSRLLR